MDSPELQHAKWVIESLDKLTDRLNSDLLEPCRNCGKKVAKCPAQQCKSDEEITICKSKRMFEYACHTLEFLSGRKIYRGEKRKEGKA
jgi:hypothetical protein